MQASGLMDNFHYISYAQEIIFEADALAQVNDAVDRFGWRHLLFFTTRAMQRGGQVAALKQTLGDRLASIFDHVQPHVQDNQVQEVLGFTVEGWKSDRDGFRSVSCPARGDHDPRAGFEI